MNATVWNPLLPDTVADWNFPRFDDQNTWELVELKVDSETQLLKATALLQQCLGRITDHWVEDKVKEFLTEVGIEY